MTLDVGGHWCRNGPKSPLIGESLGSKKWSVTSGKHPPLGSPRLNMLGNTWHAGLIDSETSITTCIVSPQL